MNEECVHLEVYSSTRGGAPIRVFCGCPIGRDHTFSEWHDGHADRRGRARSVIEGERLEEDRS